MHVYRRTSPLLIFLATFLILLFLPTSQVLADPTGVIAGVATEVDGITPVTTAIVCVEAFDFTVWYGCTPVDPVDGTFGILGFDTGQYRVEAYAPGYAREQYPNTPYLSQAQPVNVVDGEVTSNVDFTLEPGGSVSGTITTNDAGDLAAANAFVCLNDYLTGEHLECYWDDVIDYGTGNYTFGYVPTGTYRVTASGTGYATTFFNAVFHHFEAVPVAVTAPADTPNIDLELVAAGSISGVVTDSVTGDPLGGIPVDHIYGGFGTCTDIDGSYTISNVPVDFPFVFKAGDVGWPGCEGDDHVVEYWSESPAVGGATPITLTAGAEQHQTGKNFTLDVGGSISGGVMNSDSTAPVLDATVCVNAFDGSFGVGCFPVDPLDGTYAVGGLLTYGYRVEASAPDRENELYPDTPFYNQAFPVNVTAPGETPNIDFTLGAGGAIVGQITLTDDGILANPSMCINEYDTGNHIRCRGWDVVNPDGSYAFDHLPSGSYRIDVRADGYALEFYQEATNWNDADPVSISAPADTTGINFTLDPGGTISGIVTQVDNVTPILDAEVCVESYSGGFGAGCVFVDPVNGTYSIDGIGTGGYRVEARAPGYANEHYPNTPYYGSATEVMVVAPNETIDINFSLEPGGSISGVISTADAGSLSQANVHLCVNDFATDQHIRCRQADIINYATGEYTFDHLPSGTYRLNSFGIGYINTFYNNTTNWEAATAVVVTAPGNTPNINIVLQPGGTISGVVKDAITGDPIGGIPVDLENGGYGRCTHPDGTYTLENLPLDTPLIVRAGGQGWPDCPGDAHMREYWQEAPSAGDADPITLSLGGTQFETGIDFTLDVGGTITGTVTASVGGAPIVGANVCVQVAPWGEGFGCSQTLSDGTYSLTGLPTNAYRVHIFDLAGYAGELWNNRPQYSMHGDADPIAVTAGSTVPNINFALDPDSSISGIVYASDGVTPLGNIPVGVFWGSFETCTNPDGTFTIDGLPSGIPVTVWAGGADPWLDWLGCSDAYAKEWYNNKLFDWEADGVVLGVNEDRGGIDFSLDLGGTISGTVTVEVGGAPIQNANVCVNLHPFGPGLGCAQTLADGTYSLGGLPTGSYSVNVFYAPGYAGELYNDRSQYSDHSLADPVVVTAGIATPNIDFALAPDGSISGTVYAEDGVTPLANVPVGVFFGSFETCTDNFGNFTIAGLPLETPIKVWAGGTAMPWMGCNNDGYVKEWFDDVMFDWDATDITLGLNGGVGENRTDIDFTLTPGSLVSGKITEEDGTTPIPWALACFYDFDSFGFFGCLGPDGGTGVYSIVLPAGTYKAEAWGTGYAIEFYDETLFVDTADPIVVSPPTPTQNIDFTLAPGGTFSGTITTEDSGSLDDALICVDDFATGNRVRCWGNSINPDGSYLFDNLPTGTYKFYVMAPGYAFMWYDGAFSAATATPVSVTAGSNTPNIDLELLLPVEAPTDLTATYLGGLEVELGWTDNSDDETGFQIERIDGVARDWTVIDTVAADATTAIDDTVLCGQTYSYRVSTVRGDDVSAPSTTAQATTESCSPVTLLAPADGTVTRDRTPDFAWSDQPEAEKYRIQIDNDADFSSPAKEVQQNAATYTPDSNLAPDTYSWRVQMRTAGVWGDWTAPWTFTIDREKPAVPNLVGPDDGVTVTTLPTFDWDVVVDAALYHLIVSKKTDFSSSEIDIQMPETEHTPLALADGVYYWRVRAIDEAGNSGNWTPARSVRLDAVAALAPVLQSPDDGLVMREQKPVFSWEAAADAKKYRIEISKAADFATKVVNTTTPETSYKPGVKLAKGTYFWRVSTQGSDNLWSSLGTPRSFEIDRTAPAVPVLVSPPHKAVVHTFTPTFEWEDNTEADLDHYVIQIDNNKDFSSPLREEDTIGSTYTPISDLTASKVFWRVRAVDAVGNQSAWTAPRKLEMTPLKEFPGFRR